jgi:hypothetical protein
MAERISVKANKSIKLTDIAAQAGRAVSMMTQIRAAKIGRAHV